MEKHTDQQARNQFVSLKKTLIYGLPIAVVCISIMFGLISWYIGSSVESICAEATSQYSGDKIEALILYADSDNHSLGEKNHAIWALGQLGDDRALPMLETLYTGEPCDHDNCPCQHELSKAIKLCKGSTNIPAWLWR